jgi:carboxyl-terminal processing protease
MLNASNRLIGMCFGAPDVCLTQVKASAIPIPYPNSGFNTAASAFAMKVLICAGNAFNMASRIACTTGDQSGRLHPTYMGPVSFTKGSPKVIIEGTPGVHLMSSTMQNTFNVVGMQTVPSATNVFYGYACEPLPSQLTTDDLLALEARVQGSSEILQVEYLDDGVARMSIRVFSSDLPARAHAALERLRARETRALIVDLRGNPGGDVHAAIDFAGEFLAEGQVIATLIDVDGDETVYRSFTEKPCELRMTVLVDRHTASAAEVFAGALRAHGRAVLLGETTYGKGMVQSIVLEGEGQTYAAVARVVLPDGTEIQNRGVAVDVAISTDEPAVRVAMSLI